MPGLLIKATNPGREETTAERKCDPGQAMVEIHFFRCKIVLRD
jgi:hypothetical protein